MEIIAVDIGNTQAKLAHFQGYNLRSHIIISHEEVSSPHFWKKYLLEVHADYLIYAEVASKNNQFPTEELSKIVPKVIQAQTSLNVPIEMGYETPETLGIDRFAAILGAFTFNNINPPFLVIDLGTAVTYDYVDSTRKYLGGAISPGLVMRAKALNQFTGRLPLVNPNDLWERYLGQNTHDCLLAGIQSGLLAEVLGIIQWYRERSPENLAVFLTGGTARSLTNALPVPHLYRPHLVLEGLVSLVHYATEV